MNSTVNLDEQQVTVYKLDDNGRTIWQYPATVCERDDHHVRLKAYFNRDDMELEYTVFRRGDRFSEYFYNDRWYNIFAVYEGESDLLKGWYCNICRPATLGATAVTCADLALDLWVNPAGQTIILDEDEFAALDLSVEERRNGRSALQSLLSLAKQGKLPS